METITHKEHTVTLYACDRRTYTILDGRNCPWDKIGTFDYMPLNDCVNKPWQEKQSQLKNDGFVVRLVYKDLIL